MNSIVTGGAGFIGSHLCEKLLKESHEVYCIDNFSTSNESNISQFKKNKHFHLIHEDVLNYKNTLDKVDAIFHLASPASPNHHSNISYHALAEATMLVNTTGTWRLLEIARQKNASFLFASTSEIYGDPKVHPQPESYNGNVSTTGPRAVYDEAKRFARIFNTYGPRMLKEDMRMSVNFILQALAGKPITVFGDGKQTRSLCYVDDTVDGLYKLMFIPNAKGEIINIGSPEEHTVLEYAQIIKKLTQSSSEIILSESLPQDDPLKRKPDISKAKQLIAWEPKITLEEGLTKMIEYIRQTS